MKRTLAALAVMASLAVFSAGAGTLVIGNNAFGSTSPGPIETFDFDAGGTKVGSFVPLAAPGHNGRGVAVAGNTVFYTEITQSLDADYQQVMFTDAIHVTSFNNGAGSTADSTLPNPAPGNGIADLAFFGGALYAMTGYSYPDANTGMPPVLQVWKLNPGNGSPLSGPINIQVHSSNINMPGYWADGFTVLPNGNFLINDGDGSRTYREFNSAGLETGFSLLVPNAQHSTGVDTDGTHLFFAADADTNGHIVETDMAGNLVADVPQQHGFGEMEDISLVQPVPEPSTWALLGLGIPALLGISRKCRRA